MSLKVYRGRTLARSQALQLLFQAEATDSPLERVRVGQTRGQEFRAAEYPPRMPRQMFQQAVLAQGQLEGSPADPDLHADRVELEACDPDGFLRLYGPRPAQHFGQ